MGNILAGIVRLIVFGVSAYAMYSTMEEAKQEFNVECYLGTQKIYQSIAVGSHKRALFCDGFYFTEKKTGKEATVYAKCMFIPIEKEQE